MCVYMRYGSAIVTGLEKHDLLNMLRVYVCVCMCEYTSTKIRMPRDYLQPSSKKNVHCKTRTEFIFPADTQLYVLYVYIYMYYFNLTRPDGSFRKLLLFYL